MTAFAVFVGADGFQFLGIPPKGELKASERKEAAAYFRFPISRDPPEGGTKINLLTSKALSAGFQFLGIPPKGEP